MVLEGTNNHEHNARNHNTGEEGARSVRVRMPGGVLIVILPSVNVALQFDYRLNKYGHLLCKGILDIRNFPFSGL